MDRTRTYTLRDLARESEFDARRIRSWIQQGVLPPPRGKGRGAYYVEEHLDRVLFIRKLHDSVDAERLPLGVLRETFAGLYGSDDPEVVHRVAVGEEKLQVAGIPMLGAHVLRESPVQWEVPDPAARDHLTADSRPEEAPAASEACMPPMPPRVEPAKRRAPRSAEPWTTIEIQDGLELRLRGVEPDNVAGLARLAQRLREWIREES